MIKQKESLIMHPINFQSNNKKKLWQVRKAKLIISQKI